MKNIFKKVNWKTFMVFFLVMSLINIVIIPVYINDEAITFPRIIIGVVVSLIAAFIISLTAKPKKAEKQ
jgi:prepilin signal peptidase PulO-like enzyme (type II secretory pathway)